jgi:hypothetical protein
MGVLTDGPFGPGAGHDPAMPGGDFQEREVPHDPAIDGLTIQGAEYGLDGQPRRAAPGSWGDMSWIYMQRRR